MYNTSLKRKWDNKNVLDYAVAEGEIRGEARGEQKGKHEKAIEVAFKLLMKGMSNQEIVELTGLTLKEIESLSQSQ